MFRFNKGPEVKKKSRTLVVFVFLTIILLAVLVPQHQANAWCASVSGCATDIGKFILGLVGQAVSWFAQAFDAFIRYQTDSGVYNIVVVDQGWTIIRNFVNMLFILVLIITAFGTIFDIQKYSWKNMLAPFIIAALLINFSLAIGQYIITVSNGLASVFLEQIASSGSLSERLAQGFSPGNVPTATLGAGGIVIAGADAMFNTSTTLIFGIVWLIIMLIVFLSLFIFAIFRLLALWFLLIISPIAWFGYALPNLRANMWNKWWEHFLCWCFFLPYYLFFLMFAVIFINSKDSIPGVSSTASVALGTMTLNNILFYGVTLVLLIYGLAMAKKMACASGTYVGAAFGRIEAGVRKYAPGAGYVRSVGTGIKTGAEEKLKEYQERGVPIPGTGYRYGGEQAERLRAARVAERFGARGGTAEVARMAEIEKEAKRIREQLIRLPADQQKAFLEAEKSKRGLVAEAATLEHVKQGYSQLKDYQEAVKKFAGEQSAFMRQYLENLKAAKLSDLFKSPDEELRMAKDKDQTEGTFELVNLRRELFKDLAKRDRINTLEDYNQAKELLSPIPTELRSFLNEIKAEAIFTTREQRQEALLDSKKKIGDAELEKKLVGFMQEKKEIADQRDKATGELKIAGWELREKALKIVGKETFDGRNLIKEINNQNPVINIEADMRMDLAQKQGLDYSKEEDRAKIAGLILNNEELIAKVQDELRRKSYADIRKMSGQFFENQAAQKAIVGMYNPQEIGDMIRNASQEMRRALKKFAEPRDASFGAETAPATPEEEAEE